MADTENKPKGRPTRLIVTSCAEVYVGYNSHGDKYVIHEVEATRENGEPINEVLRSFENLPVGEVLDVNVTPYESTKHGKSFTITRRNKPSSSQQIKELKSVIETLTERVERLEAKVGTDQDT